MESKVTNQELEEATKSLEQVNIEKEEEVTDEEALVASAKAFADPNNFSIKHPLQNRWTLWYDNPGKKTNTQNWSDNLKKVVTFDTVSVNVFIISS